MTSRVLAALAAILGAACVAAVWSLLALNGVSQWSLAPLAAAAIVLFLHTQGLAPGTRRCLVAVALYAAAAGYAAYIEASGSIGAELGLTLIEGLRRIGPEMAMAWVRAHRDGSELAAYLLGLLLAALLGAWLGRGGRRAVPAAAVATSKPAPRKSRARSKP